MIFIVFYSQILLIISWFKIENLKGEKINKNVYQKDPKCDSI